MARPIVVYGPVVENSNPMRTTLCLITPMLNEKSPPARARGFLANPQSSSAVK
jgi:hypothetical protein